MLDEALEHPVDDDVEGSDEEFEDLHPRPHLRLDVEEEEEGVDDDQEEEEKEEQHPLLHPPRCRPVSRARWRRTRSDAQGWRREN